MLLFGGDAPPSGRECPTAQNASRRTDRKCYKQQGRPRHDNLGKQNARLHRFAVLKHQDRKYDDHSDDKDQPDQTT